MVITESKHGLAFIVFFVIIAFAINSVQFHRIEYAREVRQQQFQQQQQAQIEVQNQAAAQKAAQEAEARREQAIQQADAVQAQADQQAEAKREQAIQEAAAKHAQYLARYLNSGASKTPGIESLALVVATQDGKIERTFGETLANHFKSKTVTISTSLFKPEFVSDRLFDSVFDGSPDILNKLALANSLDGLLLGRETIQYVTNPDSLDNVITANITIEIQLVPVSTGIQNQSWTFTAAGAGFSRTEAVSNAEERLIKKISDDTTISLTN